MSEKTTVYFIRHAEAAGNVGGYFQGSSDCEVSERGKLQLDALAERFAGISFDAIYSSPLKRTVSTAEAVNRFHSLDIHYDSGLREIDGGAFEGMKWEDIPVKHPHEHDIWVHSLDKFCAPGGESMQEVYSRVTESIGKIISDNAGKTLVIVSHGCALRNYLCFLKYGSIDGLSKLDWLGNTSVTLIEYENGTHRIVYEDDMSHLTDELLPPASSQKYRYESE